jgi:hypothetical protein
MYFSCVPDVVTPSNRGHKPSNYLEIYDQELKPNNSDKAKVWLKCALEHNIYSTLFYFSIPNHKVQTSIKVFLGLTKDTHMHIDYIHTNDVN